MEHREWGKGWEQGGTRGGWWGATPTANSQGPPGLGSGGLPWAPGAGSVCGAGEHRAELRPGIAGCWGSSGSGWGRGRWRVSPRAQPHLQAQPTTRTGCQPSPLRTQAPRRPWATGTPAPPAARSALPCWRPAGPGLSAAPRTAAQRHPLAYGEEAGRQKGGLQGLGESPCAQARLGLVPDMAARTGPLEARSETVQVMGAEGPIHGGIKLSKKVGGEVRWSRRWGRCLKQGQGHTPQGHLQQRVRAQGVRGGHRGCPA